MYNIDLHKALEGHEHAAEIMALMSELTDLTEAETALKDGVWLGSLSDHEHDEALNTVQEAALFNVHAHAAWRERTTIDEQAHAKWLKPRFNAEKFNNHVRLTSGKRSRHGIEFCYSHGKTVSKAKAAARLGAQAELNSVQTRIVEIEAKLKAGAYRGAQKLAAERRLAKLKG